LVQCEGFPASKIRVIHNGIDLQRYAPGQLAESARAAFGIAPEAPLACLVACLRPEKSVATFLRAAAIVHQRMPAARFVIVGDGPERQKLESLAHELGVEHCVHFAGMCADVRPWLWAMDSLVLPSICEAFPVCLLEAMACAKPVVASRVGAIPEMVRHGMNGFLVKPGDANEVAAALCRLFSERERVVQMGLAARKHVESQFDLSGMVRGYESLFIELLDRKERNHPASRQPLATNSVVPRRVSEKGTLSLGGRSKQRVTVLPR
jgi:glycosyltransferase involved in cell wall biosynthesis